jgi:hypothetical protein
VVRDTGIPCFVFFGVLGLEKERAATSVSLLFFDRDFTIFSGRSHDGLIQPRFSLYKKRAEVYPCPF